MTNTNNNRRGGWFARFRQLILVAFFALLFYGFTQFEDWREAFEERQERAAEAAEVRDTYGTALVELCETPLDATASGDLPQLSSPPKLLVLDSQARNRHQWHDTMPEAWRATSGDDVDLVVCAQAARNAGREQVETCGGFFTLDNNGNRRDYTVPRVQLQVAMVAIDPATGEAILAETLPGSEPTACQTSNSSVGAATLAAYGPGDEIVGGVGVTSFVTYINEQRAEAQYGAEIAGLCEEVPPASEEGGLPDADASLVVLGAGARGLHPWHDAVPAERQAADADTADTVACIQTMENARLTEIGSCNIVVSFAGAPQPVPQYVAGLDITLVDVESGEITGTDVLLLPVVPCPDISDGSTGRFLSAAYANTGVRPLSLPEPDVFLEWLDSE